MAIKRRCCMSYSKSYNRQNDTTYVYEVIENYWDKEAKKPRSRRRLIGKIDPATGEIVPTRSRKKVGETGSEDYKKLYESAEKEIELRDKRIAELEKMISEYLSEESSFLTEYEDAIRKRRGKTASMLKRISGHD